MKCLPEMSVGELAKAVMVVTYLVVPDGPDKEAEMNRIWRRAISEYGKRSI